MSMEHNPNAMPPDGILIKSTKVPITNTELSVFDDTFSFLKEKFANEMKKVETDMIQFSTDLIALYNATPTPKDNLFNQWEDICKSPLVHGEGNDKYIKLHFDVSQFNPEEVEVQVINDSLYVCAAHEEKSNDRTVYRELKREFLLPKGTNPELIISSVSRDGILTVQAPLPKWKDPALKIANSEASVHSTKDVMKVPISKPT